VQLSAAAAAWQIDAWLSAQNERRKSMPFSRQFVLAATAALGFFSPALADMSTAVTRTTRDVKGLGSPAEIIVDFWPTRQPKLS